MESLGLGGYRVSSSKVLGLRNSEKVRAGEAEGLSSVECRVSGLGIKGFGV